jgi:hypothetical protein
VVLTAAASVNAAAGNASHPEWLSLAVASGGLTLNSGGSLSGFVATPAAVVIHGTLSGRVACDRLTINSAGALITAP